MPRKRLDHAAVRLVLLVFVRHHRAADNEKLRAHEAHPFGAGRGREFRLFGKIDVGAQHHAHTVGRHGFQ